jgi:hypothetical protein
MKEKIIELQNELKNMIRKDDAIDLQSSNERLLTDLTETRAAMLSYKNMCSVIAEQAKNLKLMYERRKDEHDNLMNALREMQSESVDQERIGKLYFIIMLSRWQEAAVNKKYDLVINEVKELRSELINSQRIACMFEDKHNGSETEHSERLLELEKVRQ